MRMNFFAFMFVLLFVFPILLLGCLRGIIAVTRPIAVQRDTLETRSVQPASLPAQRASASGVSGGKCEEGCCICGGKPVASLFAMHYRTWRLCREHLLYVSKFVDEAKRSVPNTFIALTIYDHDTIREVGSIAKTFKTSR